MKISCTSCEMEGVIAFDGSLTIIGGGLITAESMLSISQKSSRSSILPSDSQQIPSGSSLEIRDAQCEFLLGYESQTDCTLSGFISPAFEMGGVYSVFINRKGRFDIQLDNIVTGVSKSDGDYGGSYSGGRGGFGTGN